MPKSVKLSWHRMLFCALAALCGCWHSGRLGFCALVGLILGIADGFWYNSLADTSTQRLRQSPLFSTYTAIAEYRDSKAVTINFIAFAVPDVAARPPWTSLAHLNSRTMAPTVTLAVREEEGGPINWAALHASYIAAGVVVGVFVLLLGAMMVWGPGWYRRRRAKLAQQERERQEQADGIPLSPTSTQAGDTQPKTVYTAQQQQYPATTTPVSGSKTDAAAKGGAHPITTAVPSPN